MDLSPSVLMGTFDADDGERREDARKVDADKGEVEPTKNGTQWVPLPLLSFFKTRC